MGTIMCGPQTVCERDYHGIYYGPIICGQTDP